MKDSRLELLSLINQQVVVIVISLIICISLIHDSLKLDSTYPLINSSYEEGIVSSLLESIEKIDTLILGDSHANESFNDEMLPNSYFKMTTSGANMHLNLIKLRYVLNKSNRITSVVLPLDYHSLNGPSGIGLEEYLIYSTDPIEELRYSVYKHNRLSSDYNRKLVVRWLLNKVNTKFGLIKHADGKEGTKPIFASNVYKKKVERRVRDMLHTPTIDAPSVTSMFEILEIAKQNQVSVTGVRYPLPNYYIKQVDKQNLDKISPWLERNRSKFNQVFDMRRLFKNRQDMFLNEDHLNNKGAISFTKHYLKKVVVGTL
jgi:hypothetical protein